MTKDKLEHANRIAGELGKFQGLVTNFQILLNIVQGGQALCIEGNFIPPEMAVKVLNFAISLCQKKIENLTNRFDEL